MVGASYISGTTKRASHNTRMSGMPNRSTILSDSDWCCRRGTQLFSPRQPHQTGCDRSGAPTTVRLYLRGGIDRVEALGNRNPSWRNARSRSPSWPHEIRICNRPNPQRQRMATNRPPKKHSSKSYFNTSFRTSFHSILQVQRSLKFLIVVTGENLAFGLLSNLTILKRRSGDVGSRKAGLFPEGSFPSLHGILS